jgi:hypothetical protein
MPALICVSSIQHDRLHFPTNDCFFHKKTMADREYSFEKLTRFLKGNSVKDPQSSQFDCVLQEDTCVSSSHVGLFTVK